MYGEIRELISSEYSRNPTLIDGDIDAFLDKLAEKAEFIVSSDRGKCRGFVAYYCNDAVSKTAYITFVMVIPEVRGTGIAKSLVGFVLQRAKFAGFSKCRLEVNKANEAARALYEQKGFAVIEEKPNKYLMEAIL